ncbi:kynureninase [Novosphingobium sp. PhB165]|uniref:aminotransferase class V-fold PLP-dependent enzyme n=1 Tax=Novosphingobium sp. PhB165 TaxID=2485105 RepID=UPI00104733FC|nr:aminotransferase class V-fold PLP-dependent enzyme [Novosphingobium sp. PhB165]TCM21675.1 kynureninase [Novosphingobium sp. PhB165]
MTETRDLFHLPEGGPYLLAHSVGCLPRSAGPALEAGMLAPWRTAGGDAWANWLDTIEGFRSAVATLLGVDAATVAPQTSVSAALFTLLSGLRPEPGKGVVLLSEQAFPTVGFVLAPLAGLGLTPRFILAHEDPSDPATWARHCDGSVAAIIAMHVHSNSGLVSPVTEIAALARKHGALSILDVAQSAGILPIAAREWGVDAMIGSCVKWLCGGPGAAYLHVRAERIPALEPLDVGWFAHETPFAFDIHDFRYASDARRFQGGTPSVAPFALAAEGIRTVLAIGQDALLANNRACIAAFEEEAGQSLDWSARGGTLCLTCDDPTVATQALRAAGFAHDFRGAILRASFHGWNRPEEARAFARTLCEAGVALTPAR